MPNGPGPGLVSEGRDLAFHLPRCSGHLTILLSLDHRSSSKAGWGAALVARCGMTRHGLTSIAEPPRSLAQAVQPGTSQRIVKNLSSLLVALPPHVTATSCAVCSHYLCPEALHSLMLSVQAHSSRMVKPECVSKHFFLYSLER